jgi:hypothetical protein
MEPPVDFEGEPENRSQVGHTHGHEGNDGGTKYPPTVFWPGAGCQSRCRNKESELEDHRYEGEERGRELIATGGRCAKGPGNEDCRNAREQPNEDL